MALGPVKFIQVSLVENKAFALAGRFPQHPSGTQGVALGYWLVAPIGAPLENRQPPTATTRHDPTRHDTTRSNTTRPNTTQPNTTQHDTTRHDTTNRQPHTDVRGYGDVVPSALHIVMRDVHPAPRPIGHPLRTANCQPLTANC